jgi:putative membrane protein
MHPSLPAMTTWNLDPAVLLALVLLLAAYLYAIGPLRRRRAPDIPTTRGQIVCFISAWLLLAVTLISPLDTLGRYYSFAAHTLQLFLIITVVTPLMQQGVPRWLMWTLLPTRAIRDVTRSPLFPIIAVVIFNGLILIWHTGPIFEASLRQEGLRDAEMLCFFVAGVLTWWPLLTPLDEHTHLASPFQMLYLVFESLPLDIFGVFILFTQRVFYTSYVAAPHLFGISTLEDQAIGGAILAVPGNVIDLILMSLIFFGWLRRVERAQEARERELYGDEMPLAASPALAEHNDL